MQTRNTGSAAPSHRLNDPGKDRMTIETTARGHQYQRTRSILSASLGDQDTALFDAANGSYLGLEGTANRIWQLLEAPITLDAICAVLISEYEVEPETCRQQTQGFLQDLSQRQLVAIVSGGASPAVKSSL